MHQWLVGRLRLGAVLTLLELIQRRAGTWALVDAALGWLLHAAFETNLAVQGRQGLQSHSISVHPFVQAKHPMQQ